ncbi:MAG: glutathione S-transferase family protein [Pseudomonadota bacterium]
MKLWHCKNARSIRALWALEEMGMDYELEVLPFPPRVFNKDYLGVNRLGTVPYFVDGDTHMTESSGVVQYLVERYQRYDFGLRADHAEYGDYLNWLFHSDATLTFPQTIFFRYTQLEPEERRNTQIAQDYKVWYYARLRRLNAHLEEREYLCDGRFTVADIAIHFALFFGENLGIGDGYKPHVRDYMLRLMEREGFKRAQARQEAAARAAGID